MKIARRFESFKEYTPIVPYEVLSGRTGKAADQLIKLDANENPYGPCPAVKTALANLSNCHIYPDSESTTLRAEISRFTGVDSQHLMVGAGADELIDLLCRVMLDPQDLVCIFSPTFGMYEFNTRLNNGTVMDSPRNADFSIDLAQAETIIELNQSKMVFVTSPNNPDGSCISDQDLERILSWPVLVVLDEAYIEFSGDSADEWRKKSRISQVSQHENLVVLRTFSKWAGLAGLRVGYGAFPLWLMKVLLKAKQPYTVNVAANEAALVSLQSLPYLEQNVQKIRAEYKRLFASLSQMAFLKPYPSEANFVLVKVEKGDAALLWDHLASQGIFVRRYNTSRLENMIRISVGKPDDTEKLLYALENWI